MPTVEPVVSATVGEQPEHFSGCAARTGSNATIAIPFDVALSGLLLDSGDEIAIIASDGELCAGLGVWTGQNIAISVWADDIQTEEVDGLLEGEEMNFRVWDKSTGAEIAISTIEYLRSGGTYAVDAIYIVDALVAE
jgi:hypothetical protein